MLYYDDYTFCCSHHCVPEPEGKRLLPHFARMEAVWSKEQADDVTGDWLSKKSIFNYYFIICEEHLHSASVDKESE